MASTYRVVLLPVAVVHRRESASTNKISYIHITPRIQGDNHWYIGFINTESDDLSKGATRFRTKEGKPDIRYAAYFRALVCFSFVIPMRACILTHSLTH